VSFSSLSTTELGRSFLHGNHFRGREPWGISPLANTVADKHLLRPFSDILYPRRNGPDRWTVPTVIEDLKKRARDQGLWNLWVPHEMDPDGRLGAVSVACQFNSVICASTHLWLNVDIHSLMMVQTT